MEYFKQGDTGFGARDYLANFLPGAVIIFGICMLETSLLKWAEKHKEFALAILLVGSYIAGFMCLIISRMVFIELLHRLIGDPLETLLFGKKKLWVSPLNEEFRRQLIPKLEAYWGKELVRRTTGRYLVTLCWRLIASKPHESLSRITRTISLSSFSTSLIAADFFILIASVVKGHIIIAIISVIGLLPIIRGYYFYRRIFGVNVYQMFYIWQETCCKGVKNSSPRLT
jgi:hypothetical protein